MIKNMIYNYDGSIDWVGLGIIILFSAIVFGLVLWIIYTIVDHACFTPFESEATIVDKIYVPESNSTGVGVAVTSNGVSPVVTNNHTSENWKVVVRLDSDGDVISISVNAEYYYDCKLKDRVTIKSKIYWLSKSYGSFDLYSHR